MRQENRIYHGKAAAAAGQFKKERDYWLNKLSGDLSRTSFPTPFSSPPENREKNQSGQRSELVEFNMENQLFQRLLKVSGGSDARMHVILVAVTALLLYKYTGSRDILLGVPVYKQETGGDLVNTVLTIRNTLSPELNFKDLLIRTNQTMSEAADHQNYPVNSLVYQLNLKEDDDAFPLFDVAVMLDKIHFKEYLNPVAINVLFHFSREEDRLTGRLEFNPHRYNSSMAERISGHFSRLLETVLFNVEQKLVLTSMLSDREKENILYRFNDTSADYPKTLTIHQLFSRQAARTPGNIALKIFMANKSDPGEELEYRQLDTLSSLWAERLTAKGVGRESIVVVMMDRSFTMIVALLAILKAGGAYLPIEPEYPTKRITYMLEDSAVKLCLTQKNTAIQHSLPCETMEFDLNKDFQSQVEVKSVVKEWAPGNLAYIIYTSGTTGNPKGVMIEHRHVVRLLFNDSIVFDFNENDVWTLFHSYCFDFSVWEMYGALLYGGKLVIVPKGTAMDAQRFLACLGNEKVTVLNQTPSSFYRLIAQALNQSGGPEPVALRYIIFGGEALNPARLKQWCSKYPETRLINMYGITETTVHVTYKEITDHDIEAGFSNIGGPIPTLSTYILDNDCNLLPIGVPGELAVGGEGVSRGYLNRPQLTAAKFVPNPHKDGERIYLSGDLGRLCENGEIEYLGRKDAQVKIRGYRIELGEIENRLIKHPHIKTSVVVDDVDSSGDKFLCAYVVPAENREPDIAALREFLLEHLPEYMVPLYFVPLDEIPLTTNGKLRRNALPAPEADALGPYIPPSSHTEKKLAIIWAEVLGIDVQKVGVRQSFFELGGHSLKATSLVLLIHKAFDVKIPLVEVFRTPSISELAVFIDNAAKERCHAVPNCEKREYYPLSSAQHRFYTIHNIYPHSTAYNIPQLVPLHDEFDREKLDEIFMQLIRRHESFSTSFELIEETVMQRVHDEVDFSLQSIDLTAESIHQSLDDILAQFVTPFDLSEAPLLRAALIKLPQNRQLMAVDLHHIITDGVSNDILVEEFLQLSRGQILPPLALQYRDFSQWWNSPGQQRVIEKQREFWIEKFKGRLPRLTLPVDYGKTGEKGEVFAGRSVNHTISGKQYTALKHTVKERNTTFFTLLFAVYNVLMSKLSGQEDIICGTAVAGRKHPDLMKIIGLFFSSLAMRNFPRADLTFNQFQEDVRQKSLEAFENQDYPFERLVRDLGRMGSISRDAGRNPLFNTMFSLHNFGAEADPQHHYKTRSGELDYDPFALQQNAAKFDLLLNVVEHPRKIDFVLDYSTNLFTESTANQIMENFFLILDQVIENEGITLRAIKLKGELAERAERIIDDNKELRERDFWLDKLSGERNKTAFPYDIKLLDNSLRANSLGQIAFQFNPALSQRLRQVSNQSDIRLFIMLLSGVTALLTRYTGISDTTVLSPIDRQEEGTEFINSLLILRNQLDESAGFKELLLQTSQTLSKAMEHVNFPLETLFYHLGLEYNPKNVFPLSDVMVLLENVHDKNYVQHIHTNIRIEFYRQEEIFGGRFFYHDLLFQESTIRSYIYHLKRLLQNGLFNLETPIEDLEIISPEEKQKLLVTFNRTEQPDALQGSLTQLFSDRARETPDQVAIIYKNHSVTYKELERRAQHLADILCKKGVRRSDIVALLSHRSCDMIIAILGTLYAGAAYLPLSPDNPPQRNLFMLKDSQANVVITAAPEPIWLKGDAGTTEIISRDVLNIALNTAGPIQDQPQLTPDAPSATDLAYVIYTSGSSGQPKAVMMEHHSVINLVRGLNGRIYKRYNGILKVSLVAPYMFDASVQQIFAAILLGNTLDIAAEEDRVDGEGLLHHYFKHCIDISDGTPSHLRLLLKSLEDIDPPQGQINHTQFPVKHFIIGGEALPRPLVEQLFSAFALLFHRQSNIEISNVYGPTECCVDSTSYLVTPGNVSDYSTLPIGRPMPGEQIYILDHRLGLKPIGAVGELCIGGAGVSRGYLKRQSLTAEKFVPNPYAEFVSRHLDLAPDKDRIYRTGDMARWLPDGNIQFLVRMDNQVQLRGFRIEIGEIENVLLSHVNVREALVLLRHLGEPTSDSTQNGDDDLYICAYILSDKMLVPAALREFMLELLPEYMIPSFFIQLKQFPLTPNGKIDRKRLPGPERDGHLKITPTQTPLQEKLQSLWADVLGIEGNMIGIDRSFFEVGGHSLKATILISRLAKVFNVKVAIADIFSHSTIRQLAQHLETITKTLFTPIVPTEEKHDYVLSSAQKRLYIIHQLLPESNGYNSPAAVLLTGKVDRRRIEFAFKLLIQRHESIRTAFITMAGQLVQRICHPDEIEFNIQYWEVNEKQEADRLLRDFVRPFDLSRAPLLRAGLIRLGENRNILTVDMHHIISDGVSEELLLFDFLALYHNRNLPPLRLQYKDFALWQNKEEQLNAIRKQEEYWVNRFSGKLPVVDLPGDYPRPPMQSFEGNAVRFQLTSQLTNAVNNLASDTGTTLYMVLLAAFNVLIGKLSGEDDIVIGSPIAGRRHTDLERIVGMFVNILAIRNSPTPSKSFQAFLGEVQETSLQAFENQEYPYEDLVDRVVRKRNLSRNPLFDVVFNLLNVRNRRDEFTEFNDLKMESYDYEFDIIKFDLLLTAQQVDEILYFSLEYCTRLFKEETITRWGNHFICILETVTSEPDTAVREIDIPFEHRSALQGDNEDPFAAAGQFKRERDYWLEQLSGDLVRAELPYSTFPLDIDGKTGEPSMESVDFNLDERLSKRLIKISGASDSRIHVALTAAVSLLLHKYSGLEDVILGTPVYKQETQADLVNTVLALRNIISPEQSFKELLLQVNRTVADAADHQNYPIHSLAFQLNMHHADNLFPLFDVAVLLENIQDNAYMTPVNINILFHFSRKGQDISGRVEFNSKNYDQSTVERFIDHLTGILENYIFNVEKPLKDIEMLSVQEKERLLKEFNHTAVGFPEDVTLDRLFSMQVNQTPDNTAVISPDSQLPGPAPSLTYRELDEKASLLAQALTEQGAGPDTIIALLLERSIDMVVGIMAILKTGAAYLPIGLDYPLNRILYMLTDSAAPLCLTATNLAAEHTLPCRTFLIDQPIENTRTVNDASSLSQPSSLAYIIYTSGTSGNPKGVMINHRNVVRLIFNDAFQFQFSARDVWTLFHSYSFDFSVWEMYGALLYGGKLVVLSRVLARDTHRFLECLGVEKVSVLNQTPSSFHQLMELILTRPANYPLLALRYVIFGGEALNPSRLKQWQQRFPQVKLINMYGITETTVHVTFKEITPVDIAVGTSNIGKPIPTLATYIMGPQFNLLPVGAPGEIVVSGWGVARGYLNRPLLTSEKFVPNPYNLGEIMYRSGDLGRLCENGDILYLGRIDSQIKIRGFRIELGEIEQRLTMIKSVKSAVVVDYLDGNTDKFLCAYVVPKDYQDYDVSSLRDHLASDLPEYMVPSYFVRMERIPLTANGKVDHKALPDPEINGIGPYVPPGNDIEERLTQIWAEVLRIEPGTIGVEHDFFDLGGHSLKATSLALAIHKAFNTRIPLAEIFKTPTIRELAVYIRGAAGEKFEAIPLAEKKEYYPLSAAQSRFYTIHNMFPDSTAYNIFQAIPMTGSPDPDKLEFTFWELIRRHEVLRTTFDVVRGEAVQRIHDTVPFHLRYIDLSESGDPMSLEDVMNGLVAPFDLTRAPLLRAALVSTPDKQSILVVDIHHIVTDGTSNQLLIEDFNALNEGRALTPLTLQYKDFANWQNTGSQQRKIQQQETFWLKEFAGEIPLLELPTDFPRQSERSLQGDSVSYIIPENLTTTLKHMAHTENVTLFMLLLAAYNVLLMKICGQEEIAVGTGINGRRDRSLMRVIGLFFTPLAMRSYPKAEKTFKEFLEEVKETTINVFENQDYPFEKLVQRLTEKGAIQPYSNRNPLYDTMFGFHEPIEKEHSIHPQDPPETPPEHQLNHDSTAKLDLLLNTLQRDNTLWLVMDYSTMLFKRETVERIVNHYMEILEQVVADKNIKLLDIRLSGDVEEIVSKVDDVDATNFTF